MVLHQGLKTTVEVVVQAVAVVEVAAETQAVAAEVVVIMGDAKINPPFSLIFRVLRDIYSKPYTQMKQENFQKHLREVVLKTLEKFIASDEVFQEGDLRLVNHTITYNNPVSLYMGCQLREGLIHTYPIDKSIQYVKDYFQLEDWRIQKSGIGADDNGIVVRIPSVGINVELIKKAMSLCGYHLSYPREENIPQNEEVELFFKAKHEDDRSEQIRQEETTLLHITPAYNEGKIRHIGLSPKSKNDLFDYPDRIYLLRGSTPKDRVLDLIKRLHYTNKSLGNNGEYLIYRLDLSRIPENVKLCIDTTCEFGLYATQNIRPDVIIGVEKVQL